MNGDRIAMSQRERDRLRVMAPVLGKVTVHGFTDSSDGAGGEKCVGQEACP